MMEFEITKDKFYERLVKYRMLVDRGLLTIDEHASENLGNLLWLEENCLEHCIENLIPSEVDAIDQLLDTTIRNCNFMPFPSSFLVRFDNEDLVEAKKLELRPRYVLVSESIASAKRTKKKT